MVRRKTEVRRSAEDLTPPLSGPVRPPGAVHSADRDSFRQDALAARFGFESRDKLLAASTSVAAADGTAWWATATKGGKWVLWNDEDMSAKRHFATVRAAQKHLQKQRPEKKRRRGG